MPFKSKAQQKKMFALESEGKIKKGTAEKWAKETPNIKALPQRLPPKKPVKSLDELKARAAGKKK